MNTISVTRPLISVCLVSASFSRVKFLCRAIDSVLRQSSSREFIELIVVCESQVAAFLGARYGNSPLSFVAIPEALSLHRARRLGFEGSNGKHVLFVDDDDFLGMDALPKLLEVVIADETVDIVDSPKRLWQTSSNTDGGLLSSATVLPSGSVTFASIVDSGMVRSLSFTLAGRLIRRDLLSKSFTHEWDYVHEDVLEFFLLFSEPVNVVSLSVETYFYRRGHSSLTSRRSLDKLRTLFFAAGIVCSEMSKFRSGDSKGIVEGMFNDLLKKMDPVRQKLSLPEKDFRRSALEVFREGLGEGLDSPNKPRDLVTQEVQASRPNSVIGKFVVIAFAKYHLFSAAALIDCSAYPQLWAVIDLTEVTDDEKLTAVREKLGQFLCKPSLLDDHSDFLSALGVITFNDHHLRIRNLLQTLVANNVIVVGIIEGLYDLTGQMRHGKPNLLSPYQASDAVVAPSELAGNAIIENRLLLMANPYLWSAGQEYSRRSEKEDFVLINFNFTYGIRMGDADDFLARAISVSVAAGYEPVISVHPAARVPSSYVRFVSTEPIENLVGRAKVVVSRYSTVLLLARRLGVPAIYFNPGGEQNAVTSTKWTDLPVISGDEQLLFCLESLREEGKLTPLEAADEGAEFLATFGGRFDNFQQDFQVVESWLAKKVRAETPLSSIELRSKTGSAPQRIAGRTVEQIIRRLFPTFYLVLKRNDLVRGAVRRLRARL